MNFKYLITILILGTFFFTGCTGRPATSVKNTPSGKSQLYTMGILKSTDGGFNWDAKSFVKKNEDNADVSISDSIVINLEMSYFNKKDIVVGTLNNGMYITHNGGENWNPLFTKNAFTVSNFSYTKESGVYFVAYQNKLYKTSNAGIDWQEVYRDPEANISAVRSNPYNSLEVLVVLVDGRVLKSSDKGLTWFAVYDIRTNEDVAKYNKVQINNRQNKEPVYNSDVKKIYFNTINSDIFYVLLNNSYLFVTYDGGSSFTKITSPSGNIRFMQFFPSEINRYILVTDNGLFYTTNGGDKFQAISLLNSRNKKITALGISPSNPNIIYYALSDLMYKTKDGGSTWTVLNPVTNKIITSILVDPKNPDALYIGIDPNVAVGGKAKKSMMCDLFGLIVREFCN